MPGLGLHLLIGALQPVEMLPGLMFIPVTMIATWFSTRWSRRMNTVVLRRIVAGAMVLMGVYLALSPVLPF